MTSYQRLQMIDNPVVELIPREAAKEVVTETARLVRDTAGFLGKVFGTIPEDTVGVLGGIGFVTSVFEMPIGYKRVLINIEGAKGIYKTTKPKRSPSYIDLGFR